MVEVTNDVPGKLVRIGFSGSVTLEQVRASEPRVETAVSGMQPGFRLLTDLSGLEFMDPACLSSIRNTMDLCNRRGVSRVVRVIPDPLKDIGLNILSLFHYRHNIPIVTFETLSEAMAALADGP